jgi:hypothetical protein
MSVHRIEAVGPAAIEALFKQGMHDLTARETYREGCLQQAVGDGKLKGSSE